jgi:predicted ATPase
VIRRVSVRNFKSLNDFSVELGDRNVIVGANMSGKSNFISVFKFLSRMVLPGSGAYGLPSAVNEMGGFADLAWRGGNSNLVSISLSGDFVGFLKNIEDDEWRYSIEFVSDGRGHISVQEETLVFRGPSGEHAAIRKDSDGRRVIASRQRGGVSLVSDSNRSALEFEIPEWEGNTIRQMFATFRFYNLIPTLMKQINTTAAPYFLDENGGNLSAWLLVLQTRYQEYFQKINLAAKGVFPDIASVFTFPTQQSTVLVASSEQYLRTPVPVWQMSDGELCFIAWLSLIFCPPDLGAPVYFIEEPENHLHPRAIEALTGLMAQVQAEIGLNRAQVIATTHSLVLVDKTSVEDLIVFEKVRGATSCVRPREKRHLQELLSRKEIGLGDLYYSGALGHD